MHFQFEVLLAIFCRLFVIFPLILICRSVLLSKDFGIDSPFGVRFARFEWFQQCLFPRSKVTNGCDCKTRVVRAIYHVHLSSIYCIARQGNTLQRRAIASNLSFKSIRQNDISLYIRNISEHYVCMYIWAHPEINRASYLTHSVIHCNEWGLLQIYRQNLFVKIIYRYTI